MGVNGNERREMYAVLSRFGQRTAHAYRRNVRNVARGRGRKRQEMQAPQAHLQWRVAKRTGEWQNVL